MPVSENPFDDEKPFIAKSDPFPEEPPPADGLDAYGHVIGFPLRDKVPPITTATPPAPYVEINDPGYDASLSVDQWHALEIRDSGQAVRSSPEARKAAGKNLLWSITEPWDESQIPPRPWIAKGYLMRGAVSVLAGAGSAGKSSTTVAWACAMALGSAFGRFKVKERLRILIYNIEDDADEQKRRFSAMMRRMGCDLSMLVGQVMIIGPNHVGTLLTVARDGSLLVSTPVFDALEEIIENFQPDVCAMDPFVELHDRDENDNTAIRGVMARMRALAVTYKMAVLILHHANKNVKTPGDPDSLRGASSIVGAARVVLTLNVMSEEEAKTLGVDIDDRRDYYRMDGAKSNYAPIGEAEWYHREEIILSNGPDPDGVAVAWPWTPSNPLARFIPADLNRALDIIASPGAGWLWSPDIRARANGRWAGQPIIEMTGCNDQQAVFLITAWLRTGLLKKENFLDPIQRKNRTGVRVDDSKRPT